MDENGYCVGMELHLVHRLVMMLCWGPTGWGLAELSNGGSRGDVSKDLDSDGERRFVDGTGGIEGMGVGLILSSLLFKLSIIV